MELFDAVFRMYDAQTGRFHQIDPLAEIDISNSPYNYSENNPSFNDRLGLFSFPVEKSDDNDESSINWAAESVKLYQLNAGVTSKRSGNGGNGGWKDLYKDDLKRYYKEKHAGEEGTEYDLGHLFEDLFEDFVDNNSQYAYMGITRYDGSIFRGGDRNTKPDFTGNVDIPILGEGGIVIRIDEARGSDSFELKQKSGGLYLSSNEGQIKGHIDNLRRSTDDAYQKYRQVFKLPDKITSYHSKLWVITTADVKFSPGIREYARSKQVLYSHISAEYRIVNGAWEFRFIKRVKN